MLVRENPSSLTVHVFSGWISEAARENSYTFAPWECVTCILFKHIKKPDTRHGKYEKLSKPPPAEHLEQRQSSKREKNCRVFH